MTDPRVHRRVQRYGWDLAAASYDDAWVPRLKRFGAGCVERAAIRPGDRVLDVATGTGSVLLLAAERTGPTGEVVGSDISEKMVAEASARAAAAGVANARFVRADMEALDLPDASFDVVLCAFGLMYAADTDAACRELARVLAPGGRLAVCVWGRRSACGWAEVFPIVDRRVQSDVCPLFFALGTGGALAASLERAGLANVREEREPTTLEWPDEESACAAMLLGGPVSLAVSKMTPEVKDAVWREYADSIARYRGPTGYAIAAEMVYGIARNP